MQLQHQQQQQLQPPAPGDSWHYGMPKKAREAEAEAKAMVLREMLLAKQADASRSPGGSSSQPLTQWEVVDRELDTEAPEQGTMEEKEKTEDGCLQVAGLKPKASSRAHAPGNWGSPPRRRPAEAEGGKGDNRSVKREEGKAAAGDTKSCPGPVPPWRRKSKARLRSPSGPPPPRPSWKKEKEKKKEKVRLRSPSGPPPPRPSSKKEKKKEKAAKDKDDLARALLEAEQSLLRRP